MTRPASLGQQDFPVDQVVEDQSKMDDMVVVHPLRERFENGVECRAADARQRAKGLAFFVGLCLDERDHGAVVGRALVEFDIFGVTDQPSQRIGDGIGVREGAAGRPPGDTMEPHGTFLAFFGHEVAENAPWDCQHPMRLLQIGGVCRKPTGGVVPARHTEWIDMAKKVSAKARAAARKQRDKWKMKRWYAIRAPRHPWNFKRIGETLGESDEHIVGRVYEMTQQQFDGNFSKMHVVMRFRVTECVGQDALTVFIGHHHQTDHIRRQIRRYRGKVDDVVDVVTTDGYLVRMKPLIITQQRVQTSVKKDMRGRAREIILAFAAKNTYADVQMALLDGKLEESIEKGVKSIYPVRSVAIRKSQLLQEGVVPSFGPTLDEIHAEEARVAAELKARKKAALEEAMAEEEAEAAAQDDEEADGEAAAEEPEAEAPVEEVVSEEVSEEATEESAPEATDDVDYASMTVAELKELLKAAGKPVSGKKDDLIARLKE